jgi:hypothetical protein
MTRRERNDIVGTAPEELSASDRTGNRSRISMATRNAGVSGDGDGVVGLLACQYPSTFQHGELRLTKVRIRSFRRVNGTVRDQGLRVEKRYGPMDGVYMIAEGLVPNARHPRY